MATPSPMTTAQPLLVGGLAEQPLAGAEHDREDLGPRNRPDSPTERPHLSLGRANVPN
jgi:hypothetical protein